MSDLDNSDCCLDNGMRLNFETTFCRVLSLFFRYQLHGIKVEGLRPTVVMVPYEQ